MSSESRKLFFGRISRMLPNGISISRFLSYLILPKPTSSITTTNSTGGAASGHHAASNGEAPREKEREHSSSRISGAISNSITSMGDVFRDVTARDGSKNVKFPEKLLKVLENRLENIAMGKDSACVTFLPKHPHPTPGASSR